MTLAETDPNALPVVEFVGMNGNAFAIIGTVSRALRRAGLAALVPDYQREATSGNYDHLLQVSLRYTRQPTEEEWEE